MGRVLRAVRAAAPGDRVGRALGDRVVGVLTLLPAVVSRQSQTQECATVTVSLLLRCGPDGGRGLQVRTHCTPRPPLPRRKKQVRGRRRRRAPSPGASLERQALALWESVWCYNYYHHLTKLTNTSTNTTLTTNTNTKLN